MKRWFSSFSFHLCRDGGATSCLGENLENYFKAKRYVLYTDSWRFMYIYWHIPTITFPLQGKYMLLQVIFSWNTWSKSYWKNPCCLALWCTRLEWYNKRYWICEGFTWTKNLGFLRALAWRTKIISYKLRVLIINWLDYMKIFKQNWLLKGFFSSCLTHQN